MKNIQSLCFLQIQDHIQQTLNNHTYASHGYLCPYRASNVGGNEKLFLYVICSHFVLWWLRPTEPQFDYFELYVCEIDIGFYVNAMHKILCKTMIRRFGGVNNEIGSNEYVLIFVAGMDEIHPVNSV